MRSLLLRPSAHVARSERRVYDYTNCVCYFYRRGTAKQVRSNFSFRTALSSLEFLLVVGILMLPLAVR